MNALAKKRRSCHAQLHLPKLTGHEALVVVGILDRVIAALWRVHGEEMGACLSGDAIEIAPVTELSEEDRVLYEGLF